VAAVPAERAPVQEHPARPMDPVEAVRVPDRRVCELRRVVELQLVLDHQPHAEPGVCGAAVQFQQPVDW